MGDFGTIDGSAKKRLVKIGWNQLKSVKARFNGKCVECGEPIKVGKEILKNSKDKWVHKACSDLEEELPWIGTN